MGRRALGSGRAPTPSDDANNFSFTPDGNFYYRLRVEGGTRDGQFSNVVFAEASSMDPYLAGWSVDSSMFLTGVMYPWVGHGMQASFSVRKLSDNSDVTAESRCNGTGFIRRRGK